MYHGDVRLERALRRGLPPCLIVYVDHPDGAKRYWSRSGPLTWDGQVWDGVGAIGRVSGVSSSTRLSLRPVTFQLSGLPANRARFIGSKVKGRLGRLWLGAVKETPSGEQLVCEPDLICEARLDYQTLKGGDNGTVTLQITGHVGIRNISQPSNGAWTHERQIARYPDDTGLSLIPSLVNKPVKWRKTA